MKLIEPPDQLLQFEHRTFAVITLPEIPEPASSVTLAAVEVLGCESPVPRRVESVTFVPAEFAYIKNMFEFFILEPWPRAIQLIDVGPVIWKYISPEPLEAVAEGTLTAKQAPPVQYWALCARAEDTEETLVNTFTQV